MTSGRDVGRGSIKVFVWVWGQTVHTEKARQKSPVPLKIGRRALPANRAAPKKLPEEYSE
jgi:hypothetical protein